MTIVTTMTMTAAATAIAAASVTAMGGAQTTINLSYRNGGGCSWATAGRRLCNVKGKGEDGGTVTVMGEDAMPPNLGIVRPHPYVLLHAYEFRNPQQYLWIIPFWNSPPKYLLIIPFWNSSPTQNNVSYSTHINKRIIPFWNSPPKPTTIFTDYSILE